MHVHRTWLRNFRSHGSADLTWDPGVNLIVGPNGSGKTNLVEAIAFLSTGRSFRGAPVDALTTVGSEGSTVRAEVDHGERRQLVEIDLPVRGRTRTQVNRQRVSRRRDLLEVLQVTVFGPDDLELVKGGPGERRNFLDEVVVQLRPADELVVADWERALRQRNSFLKQARGRLDGDATLTLDVWDTKAAVAGAEVHGLRRRLVERLEPYVATAYGQVSRGRGEASGDTVELGLIPGWSGDAELGEALRRARDDDLRRGVTTVGPHRDDLSVLLAGLPTRTHASQGEQRCVALALRLAAHRLVTETRDQAPVLVLDDVFSELDDDRAAALVHALPVGQTFITSATGAPPGVIPDHVVRLSDGHVVADDR